MRGEKRDRGKCQCTPPCNSSRPRARLFAARRVRFDFAAAAVEGPREGNTDFTDVIFCEFKVKNKTCFFFLDFARNL